MKILHTPQGRIRSSHQSNHVLTNNFKQKTHTQLKRSKRLNCTKMKLFASPKEMSRNEKCQTYSN